MMSKSWTGPVTVTYGVRVRVAECARCERQRAIEARGLCHSCRTTCQANGTIGEYGYVKPDRLEDYAYRRGQGDSPGTAAGRLGISKRTACRYETQLAAAGRAPWRDWPVA